MTLGIKAGRSWWISKLFAAGVSFHRLQFKPLGAKATGVGLVIPNLVASPSYSSAPLAGQAQSKKQTDLGS